MTRGNGQRGATLVGVALVLVAPAAVAAQDFDRYPGFELAALQPVAKVADLGPTARLNLVH